MNFESGVLRIETYGEIAQITTIISSQVLYTPCDYHQRNQKHLFLYPNEVVAVEQCATASCPKLERFG